MNTKTKDERIELVRSNDETLVGYAVVAHCPIERIPDIKNALKAIPGVHLVYQKLSAGRLEIVERA